MALILLCIWSKHFKKNVVDNQFENIPLTGTSKEDSIKVAEDPVVSAKKKAFPGLAIPDGDWEPLVKETEVGY